LALATQLSAQGVPPAGGPIRTAPAAAPPAASSPSVVVIDIANVFKSHNRFNATMLDIKNDIEQFEAYVRKKQTDFKALGETLATYKAGTQEYRQKEEELARLQSDLQVEVALKRKEFLQQEARVYYRVYQEIEQEVGIFAQRNRINLVLRYNRDEMKEDDRQSVLQGVNKAVVYQYGLDITEPILKQLNGSTTAPPTTVQGGGATGQTSPNRPIVPRPNTPVPR
jgi:Skp family chaperone for outer membrane proteins